MTKIVLATRDVASSREIQQGLVISASCSQNLSLAAERVAAFGKPVMLYTGKNGVGQHTRTFLTEELKDKGAQVCGGLLADVFDGATGPEIKRKLFEISDQAPDDVHFVVVRGNVNERLALFVSGLAARPIPGTSALLDVSPSGAITVAENFGR
jgi:hypothetical protein